MKVLYIGGTGTISSACVAESVRQGFDVHVLNRGRTADRRPLPEGVATLTADVQDADSLRTALADAAFDCVVNFLSFSEEDAATAANLFTGRTQQYIHISSASIYHKPVRKVPFVESTTRHNPYLGYARAKIAAEQVLVRAYEEKSFPVTILRPSHTYDDAHPPLPGDWTAWDRVVRGDEFVVPGDGTSLWTVTHAEDLAIGLVGLVGNWQAIGEDFHITSDEILTWDEIYEIIGHAASVPARLLHLPSEFLPVLAPDWFWSELIPPGATSPASWRTTPPQALGACTASTPTTPCAPSSPVSRSATAWTGPRTPPSATSWTAPYGGSTSSTTSKRPARCRTGASSPTRRTSPESPMA